MHIDDLSSILVQRAPAGPGAVHEHCQNCNTIWIKAACSGKDSACRMRLVYARAAEQFSTAASHAGILAEDEVKVADLVKELADASGMATLWQIVMETAQREHAKLGS